MDVRVGLKRKLSAEELILLNCGVGEDSWESFEMQQDPTSPSKRISPGCSLEELMLNLKLQYSPPDVKSWLIGKDSDAGKNWGQEEKALTEEEMVEWHHQLDWYEFEQTLGDGDRQGGLACCSPWGRKESDATEWLNWLNRQFQGCYVPISLTSLLWIMAAYLKTIVWSSCSKLVPWVGVSVSLR